MKHTTNTTNTNTTNTAAPLSSNAPTRTTTNTATPDAAFTAAIRRKERIAALDTVRASSVVGVRPDGEIDRVTEFDGLSGFTTNHTVKNGSSIRDEYAAKVARIEERERADRAEFKRTFGIDFDDVEYQRAVKRSHRIADAKDARKLAKIAAENRAENERTKTTYTDADGIKHVTDAATLTDAATRSKHFEDAASGRGVRSTEYKLNERGEIVRIVSEIEYTFTPFTDAVGAWETGYIRFTAAHIVKRIATSDRRKDHSTKACFDIWKSGYTQPIFDDVVGAVAVAFLEIEHDGKIEYRENDTPLYGEYERENGAPLNAYFKLWRAVDRVLTEYSKHSASADGVVVSYDALLTTTDENGETTRESAIMKTRKNGSLNGAYLRAVAYDGGLSDILDRDDVRRFWRYANKHTKRVKRLFTLFCELSKGTKKGDIAAILGVSAVSVSAYVNELRRLWSEFRADEHDTTANIRAKKREYRAK